MSFSRYFALKIVEASKSGNDDLLRKVQTDILAQFLTEPQDKSI